MFKNKIFSKFSFQNKSFWNSWIILSFAMLSMPTVIVRDTIWLVTLTTKVYCLIVLVRIFNIAHFTLFPMVPRMTSMLNDVEHV